MIIINWQWVCNCLHSIKTNMKAIFTVMNTTWVVVKIRPEKKNQACTGLEPLWYWCSTPPTELTSQLGAGHYVGSK